MGKKFLLLVLLALIVIGTGSGFKLEESLDFGSTDLIRPGKVIVVNFSPGSRIEFGLEVYNGSLDDRNFTVFYQVPGILRGKYLGPIEGTESWISISEPLLTLKSKEVKEVLIVLDIPEYIKGLPEFWEFWIMVKEFQLGMVQTGLACRVLVSMR